MSNENFHVRLQRLEAKSTQQPSAFQGGSRKDRPGAKKMNIGQVGLGGAIFALGIQAIKYANENYEALRDSSGIGMIAVLGLGGLVAMLVGVVVLMRGIRNRMAVSNGTTTSPSSHNERQPVRQVSRRAQMITSLLGFSLGVSALIIMTMSATASRMETKLANDFMVGASVFMLLLALVVFLVGIIGIFLRGYSLARVPVYFVFGVILTFATVRILRIDMLDWPQLVAALQ